MPTPPRSPSRPQFSVPQSLLWPLLGQPKVRWGTSVSLFMFLSLSEMLEAASVWKLSPAFFYFRVNTTDLDEPR